MAHPLTGAPERVRMTREMVLASVRGPLYSPALAAALPAAMHAAAQGRFDALLGLGASLGSGRGAQVAMGMHFSVVCSEDVPLLTQTMDLPGADFGRAGARLYEQVCAQWPRGARAAGLLHGGRPHRTDPGAQWRPRPRHTAAPRRTGGSRTRRRPRNM